MTKADLQREWSDAAHFGTLMVPKHDPTGLAVPHVSYRTVLSQNLADNLVGFIDSGNYTVNHYSNSDHPQTPDYYTVTPTTADFSVPGSGVPRGAASCSTPMDTLVFVSGAQQGWHCFGESSSQIGLRAQAGTLSINGPVA